MQVTRTGLLVAAGVLVVLVLPVATWSLLAGSSSSDDEASPAVATTTTTARVATSVTTAATTTTTVPPTTVAPAPPAGDCTTFPPDSYWSAKVTSLPVHPRSAAYVASIGLDSGVKADFGSGEWDGGPIGIPITTVEAGQGRVPVSFDYADESDPGPYPIPADAAVEGGPSSDGDRHVLVVDPAGCRLYELWDAHPAGDGSWQAGSGAVFDLRSDALRPAGWTSADAAGLPVAPGLVRYEEVAAGHIDHAIRVTVPRTQDAYVWPARHAASSDSDPSLPPMGLRLRLRADADLSGLAPEARIIAQAMQTYGVIVADNGSPWYLSGTPNPHWNNDALQSLGTLPGSAFEALDTTSLIVTPDSSTTRR